MTRPDHALAGKVLEVFGRLKRKGNPHLILVLPDGTRSYIPAAWTDYEPSVPSTDTGNISLVAGLADLWRTRQRVDALLRRIGLAAGDATSTQENQHASKSNGTMVCGTASDSAPLLATHPRTADAPCAASGVSHAQTNSSSDHPVTSLNSRQNL